MSHAIQKLCCFCGENLAGKKRTKDSAGNYYCPPCWAENRSRRRSAADEGSDPFADALEVLATAQAPATADYSRDGSFALYPCDRCGGHFAAAHMSAGGVCRECASPARQRNATTAAAPKRRTDRSPKTRAKTVNVIVATAVTTAVVVLFVVMSATQPSRLPRSAEVARAVNEKPAPAPREESHPKAEAEQPRGEAWKAEAKKAKEVSGEIRLTRGDGSQIVPVDTPVYALAILMKNEEYAAEVSAAQKALDEELKDSLWDLPGMETARDAHRDYFAALQKQMGTLMTDSKSPTATVLKTVGLAATMHKAAVRAAAKATDQPTSGNFSEYAGLAEDPLFPMIVAKALIAKARTDSSGRFLLDVPNDTLGCLVVAIYQDNFSIAICTYIAVTDTSSTTVMMNTRNATIIAKKSN